MYTINNFNVNHMFLSSKIHVPNKKGHILHSDIAGHYCAILLLNTKQRKYRNNNNSYQAFTKSNYSFPKQILLCENWHDVQRVMSTKTVIFDKLKIHMNKTS